MPCYDPGDPFHERHNSPVAKLLCEATDLLRAGKSFAHASDELVMWVAEHMARDERKRMMDAIYRKKANEDA